MSVNGTITYSYNGIGDRLSQTVNGVPTNYILDLNAGLTQVLSDGTNTYTYGLVRISQQRGGTPDYFLSDALGSVRQMTDQTGAITYTQMYDPYGMVTATSGTSQTDYSFTGESYDTYIKLIYLRSRYYNPANGRFQSRDTWGGNVNSPRSLNRWGYVEGNPVNYFDPSGHIAEGHEAREADVIRDKLKIFYGVEIQKDWGYISSYYGPHAPVLPDCMWKKGNWRSVEELNNVFEGVKATAKEMGGAAKFRMAMKNQPALIRRVDLDGTYTPHTLPFLDIVYFNYEITNQNYIIYTTIHEFGHVWDIRTLFRLSSEMSRAVGTHYCNPESLWGDNSQWPACYYDWTKGQELPPGNLNDPDGPYAGKNAREDWAESFAVYIDSSYHPNFILRPIRKQYVQDKINSIH